MGPDIRLTTLLMAGMLLCMCAPLQHPEALSPVSYHQPALLRVYVVDPWTLNPLTAQS